MALVAQAQMEILLHIHGLICTNVKLSDATITSPTFVAPTTRKDLGFSLVVNDGVFNSIPDSEQVTPVTLASQHISSNRQGFSKWE